MPQSYVVPLGNFAGLTPEEAEFTRAGVAIVPVPYDATASFHAGARDGPAAIIVASNELELYDPELDWETSQTGIHTLPLIEPLLGDPQAMLDRVAGTAQELLGAGKLVGMLGGEHTLTIGAVQAHTAVYPDLSVLCLDAHADLRDSYMGTRLGHASTVRRVVEICPTTLVGMRSLALEEKAVLDTPGLTVVPARQAASGAALERIVAGLSPNVYLSIDLDVLDPSLMPAVGCPVPGGLSWQELLAIVRGVAQRRRVVGFDVMEFCPSAGPPACALTAANLVYKVIGYSVAPHRIPVEA